MSNYIRLTIPPGNIDQSANTILMNASRTSIPANIKDSFFITPVRQNVPGTQVLYYDTTTKEVTHGVAAPPTTAIWGVWGLEGDVGDPIGGIPGSGRFVPANGASYTGDISANPAEMKSIAINLEDCTGPVSPLMGVSGALSASGGYHIVIRGWDLDCSGLDVYKVQAKYAITDHKIDGGGTAAIFDVSYNNSSGVFQGEETAPIGDLKYYNIIIAQDVAPMGPTGAVGVTGPTGSPAIAASSVWEIAEDPSVGGAASIPVATEFNIENAVGNTEENPALVTKIDINIRDCNGVFWELLRNYGYLVGFYVVIRGWDLDCSGEDIYQVQTKYRITSATYTGGVASLGVSYVSSYGIFEGPSKYYNIIVGADVAPMGPTGFTGAAGAAGVTGPTGRSAIAVSATWQLGDVSGAVASDPSGTEFIPVSGGNVQVDPTLTTQIRINSLDCQLDTTENTELLIPNYLTGQKLVIRGYNDDCSGTIVEKVQAEYRITDHVVFTAPPTPPSAYMEVAYISSAGNFGELKFHNIIIGADIAPIGPTGPCCTGPTGPKGPTGLPAVGAVGIWGLAALDGVGADPALATGTFEPVDTSGTTVEWDPSSVTQLRINTTDCASIFHADMAESGLLDGAFIVVRGWDASCSGADVYKMHAKYRLTSHVNVLDTAYYGVTYVSSAGSFGGPPGTSPAYYNIILGSDIAEMGPTGPCCTGPTGATGPRGIDGTAANGVWEQEGTISAVWGAIPGPGGFIPYSGNGGGNIVVADPSECQTMMVHIDDCYDISQVHLEQDAFTIGAFLVVRGYSDDCSGGEIFLTQAKYRIVGHTYAGGVATLDLSFMNGYGSYINAKFYHIIVGGDPAPIGPTGPTGPCCTGATGPRGIDGIGANGVWEEVAAISSVGGTPGPGGFIPFDSPGGNVVADPSSCTEMLLHIDDCYDISQVHLETDAATVGAYLVVRGYSDDCSGGEIFLMQAKYRITGHTYTTPAGYASLALTYMSGYGSYVEAKFYHIIVGADPAPIGPTGPTGPCCTGPTGPAGSPAIVASSRWESTTATGAIGAPGDGEWLAGNSAGQITTDPSSVAHFRINEVDCLGDIQTRLNNNDLTGLEIVVRGWDDDCSGNLAYNTFKVRSRHRITNAVYGTFLTEEIVDLSVNYLSGFGTYSTEKFYDIVIGADIVDPGPTGPCMWILDSSQNFWGPSGSSMLNGSSGVNNVICGPSCCVAGVLDGSNNTLVGTGAGNKLTSGDNNVFIGAAAGYEVATSNGNVLVGPLAGGASTELGFDNVFIGSGAGGFAPDSSGNIGIGCKAAGSFGGVSGGVATSYNTNIGFMNGWAGVSGSHNIGIGYQCPLGFAGNQNIEIGTGGAGFMRMTDSTIILNASGTGFDASSNAFYVNPLRSATQSNVLYYNTATKEITYNTSEAAADISGVWTHDSSNNFYGPSGAALTQLVGATGNTFGGVQVVTQPFNGSNNTAFGYEAFMLAGSAEANVAIGAKALKSADFNGANTAVGYEALSLATSANNTAVGNTAAINLTTGGNNTIMGTCAGEGLTTGSNNLVLGYQAFASANGDTSGCICLNATGGDFSPAGTLSSQLFVKPIRSATASQTLYYNTTTGEITYNTSAAAADVSGAWTFDSSNNFYGPSGEAGLAGFDGQGNIAVGDGALNAFVVTGDFNVAVGTNALRDNTSGFHNVAVGRQAMELNTDGDENTALGYQALAINTTGNQNVAIGDDALVFNQTGNLNIAVGFGAMGGGAGLTTHENIAIGPKALFNLEEGHNNIAIGFEALRFQRDTSSNIAIGRQAMGGFMQSGSENVAIGHHALLNISGGFANVAVGYHAGRGGSGGGSFDVSGSIFIGYKAGDSLGGAPTGTRNIAIGYEAGATASVLSGENNILIGTKTAPGQSGDHQVLIGEQASGQGANVGNCIVLNATGSTLGATADSTFFVKPIRVDASVAAADASGLVWNPTTGEIICSTTKTFVIPYPGQPGKVLRHACVEAPTRGTNIYEYQINVTETNKTTSIDLPPYFKDLNSRPRVYVSPTRGFNCGGCGGYVNEDLTAVIVETEKPGTFNIMVTGIRKDPGAIAYSATEMIDEPTIMEDVPPSTTHTICSTQ